MKLSYVIAFALVSSLTIAGSSLALVEAASMAAGYAQSSADAALGIAQDGAATGQAIVALEAGPPAANGALYVGYLTAELIYGKMGAEACAIGAANGLVASTDAGVAQSGAICAATLAVTEAMTTQAATVVFTNAIVAA